MNQEEVIRIFQDSEALLTGHFRLTSGLHSPQYLQCALVLQHPGLAAVLGAALAQRMTESCARPSAVIAPALGGIVVAHEVARALGARAIFAERHEGVMTLRRGFSLSPGETCFVVEDVVTTGGSTLETMEVTRLAGGVVTAAGSLINRSGGKADLGVPSSSLAYLDIPTYRPEDCPLCRSGSRPIKPGSR